VILNHRRDQPVRLFKIQVHGKCNKKARLAPEGTLRRASFLICLE
jgi:hypothetical protein